MEVEVYSQHLACIAAPPPEKCYWSDKQYVRLVIVMPEPRAHPWMRPVLCAAAHVYGGDPDVALVLMHGTENKSFVHEAVKAWTGVRFVNLGVPNLTITDYNVLLTKTAFYTDLRAEFVLILQTDALLRKRIPEHFFNFDYVGAPWPWRTRVGTQVGNGGFSLRRCAAMAAVCTRDGCATCNEDGYFSTRVSKLPPVDLASSFSVEIIQHPDPVGFHQVYKYHDLGYVVGLIESTPGYQITISKMHPEARHFLDYCQAAFGSMYKGKVLDIGSGDINGNNRCYFPNCEYTGCDIAPGPNVDVVSPCHLLPYNPESFDVVVSSECFEHDMYYAKSIAKIVEMVKPGGLFIFTCASTGRAEHGTLRTSPSDSFTTQLSENADWGNYYKNLTASDVCVATNIAEHFQYYQFYFNEHSKDLYFVGFKGYCNVPEYIAPSVWRT